MNRNIFLTATEMEVPTHLFSPFSISFCIGQDWTRLALAYISRSVLYYWYMNEFSPLQLINRENLAMVPSDKPGVYRINNNQGGILYIGRAGAGRLGQRIQEHDGRIPNGTHFQYCTTSTEEDAERLERQEIQIHKPPFNKQQP